jgi:hypothetical protein
VLKTIYGVIELSSANVTFIHEDLPEILNGFLSKENLREISLKILVSLFDDSIGLCSHKHNTSQYKLVEDIPNITQTQTFLQSCGQFLIFQVSELGNLIL